MSAQTVTVEVEGQRVRLSNLDKVLYPEVGFTKGEVIDYYTRIAPVLLPHLADRPVTLHRFPDGVDAQSFWNKDASRNAPEWLRLVRLPTPGSSKGHEEIGFAVLDGLPALVWAANLAGLELHVPQWTVDPRGEYRCPTCWCSTSTPARRPPSWSAAGWRSSCARCSKRTACPRIPRPAAPRACAVLARMSKAARSGKVFVDWSQNNPAKTTIAPYSLRARPHPTVSTPVTWEEVAACRTPEQLVFTSSDVLTRVQDRGDLMAPLLGQRYRLPPRGR